MVEQAYITEQEKNNRIRLLESQLEDEGRAFIEQVRGKDIQIRNTIAQAQDARKDFEDRLFELDSSLQLHRLNTLAVKRKREQLSAELGQQKTIHAQQEEKIQQLQEIAQNNKADLQKAAELIGQLEEARNAELESARAADSQMAALEQQRQMHEAGLKSRLGESEAFARALEFARNQEYMENHLRDQEIASMSGHTSEMARSMAEQATDAHDLIAALNTLLTRQEGVSRNAGQQRDLERMNLERDKYNAESRLRMHSAKIDDMAQRAALADAQLATQSAAVRNFRSSPSRTNEVLASAPAELLARRVPPPSPSGFFPSGGPPLPSSFAFSPNAASPAMRQGPSASTPLGTPQPQAHEGPSAYGDTSTSSPASRVQPRTFNFN
eukprot:NODE_1385_length_1440_cov_21.558591_g1152_i0.p1 GENE.NODE_1385_length_1440_cov_21.558591_g1152_i0~~NODE_1385_length_1440_cov_21.558591_g1152_i0.p1  ORF type:complete len:449 (-),score=123.01 NODE_1385_length_1440_cov_21.558591_g1152_i0:93-1241(-)